MYFFYGIITFVKNSIKVLFPTISIPQRFIQHVLPKRFIKIRHYGFLSSRTKSADLERIRKSLTAKAPELTKKLSTRELMLKINGKDPYLCPKCKKDSMVIVEITPGARGSPKGLIASGKTVKL